MRDAPVTRHSLLARLGNAESHAAWEEFVRLYEPAIYRFVRRRGLQDAYANEVVQEVLLNVRTMANSEKSLPCNFRGWLSQVSKYRVIDLLRKRSRQERSVQAVAGTMAGDREQENALDAEVRHQMFIVAAQRVQRLVTEMQWQSFWQTSVELQSPQQVAQRLSTSVGNVYVAKCRVMEKLRLEIDAMIREERDS